MKRCNYKESSNFEVIDLNLIEEKSNKFGIDRNIKNSKDSDDIESNKTFDEMADCALKELMEEINFSDYQKQKIRDLKDIENSDDVLVEIDYIN